MSKVDSLRTCLFKSIWCHPLFWSVRCNVRVKEYYTEIADEVILHILTDEFVLSLLSLHFSLPALYH
jgi:hypothetical protein